MKAFERRVSKLERTMKNCYTPLHSLSDEELMLRVTSLLKRSCGEQLAAREEAALTSRQPPSTELATMTDEKLRSRLHEMLGKLLDGNGARYIRPKSGHFKYVGD